MHPISGRAPEPWWWESRVFRQFAWVEGGSGKMASSRPTQQPVTRAVGRLDLIQLCHDNRGANFQGLLHNKEDR